MKKLMMITAMMVVTMSANAQFEPGTFSIQPKIGIGLSKVSNMPPLSFGTIGEKQFELDRTLYPGVLIGAEAEYQIAKPFSLAAGINFSTQGCQWEDGDVKSGSEKIEMKDTKIELGYINVPVVANLYLFKGFAIKTGVQFGFLVSAKYKSEIKAKIGEVQMNTKFDEDIKDGCNKFDIAIPVGVSYQVPTIPIVIDARANIGLKNISKEADESVKNQVFQLTVGYKFKL